MFPMFIKMYFLLPGRGGNNPWRAIQGRHFSVSLFGQRYQAVVPNERRRLIVCFDNTSFCQIQSDVICLTSGQILQRQGLALGAQAQSRLMTLHALLSDKRQSHNAHVRMSDDARLWRHDGTGRDDKGRRWNAARRDGR